MRLTPSDPDIRTIVTRIEEGDLDLQPEFQRGEVWSESKRRKLIDSVLRNWHIPPIHVVEIPGTNLQEVLDGQQRLAAIRDFARDRLRVDGSAEPNDEALAKLDGLTYSRLPVEWRRRFDQFTIRVIRISEYSPGEPAELFFRLNQSVSLTSAEQRNAFFGPARSQVRQLVNRLEAGGISKEHVGFSNARMAYDDVLARFCWSLSKERLAEASAQELASVYRSEEGFPHDSVKTAQEVIDALGSAKDYIRGSIRLNKATFFSWLWFMAGCRRLGGNHAHVAAVGPFIVEFEQLRTRIKHTLDKSSDAPGDKNYLASLLLLYNDRATSRVSDAASLIARDAVTWVHYVLRRDVSDATMSWEPLHKLRATAIAHASDPEVFLERVIEQGWGALP